MMQDRGPSVAQALEVAGVFHQGIPGCFGVKAQEWVDNPKETKEIIRRMLNLGLKITQGILNDYAPSKLDVVKEKAKLLGIEGAQDLKIPESAWGWAFEGQNIRQMAKAFLNLGIGLADYFLHVVDGLEELPLGEGPTCLSPEVFQRELGKAPIFSLKEYQEECRKNNTQMASIEEIMDCLLGVVIYGLLLDKESLIGYINQVCFPKDGKRVLYYSILCRNRSDESVPILHINYLSLGLTPYLGGDGKGYWAILY